MKASAIEWTRLFEVSGFTTRLAYWGFVIQVFLVWCLLLFVASILPLSPFPVVTLLVRDIALGGVFLLSCLAFLCSSIRRVRDSSAPLWIPFLTFVVCVLGLTLPLFGEMINPFVYVSGSSSLMVFEIFVQIGFLVLCSATFSALILGTDRKTSS